MGIAICHLCGKEVQDNQKFCPGCGYPINMDWKKQEPIPAQKKVLKDRPENGWANMRKGFGITTLVVGIILFLIVNLRGELEKELLPFNSSSLFLIISGILQLIGVYKKGLTIATVVFYSIGVFYNIIHFNAPTLLLVALLNTVFLILTAVSLTQKESFINVPDVMRSRKQ